MILGVAQFVLNVADLDRACAPYLEAGWRETFRAEGLPNHPAKAGLQAVPRRTLDMVHLTPTEGTRGRADPLSRRGAGRGERL